jgi:hypothetical protein
MSKKKSVAQVPAEGISAYRVSDEWKWYNISCECGCNNSFSMMIEVDEHGLITTTFCADTKTNHWYAHWDVSYKENAVLLWIKQFYNNWYNRLAICWNALVHGYMETSSDIILTNQQALNISEALKTAIKNAEVISEKRKAEFAIKKAKNEEENAKKTNR